jgi:hypothetical protein
MAEDFFNIQFEHDGIHYDGMVRPSDKVREDGTPRSFHVILNNVLFGNVHYDHSKWLVDEQRPDELTEIVGKQIEQYFNPDGIVM